MTLSELRTAVLQELGVLASGETATAADDQLVADKYSALYDMLLTEGLVTWTASEDIPEYAETPITYMLAWLCLNPFGIVGEMAARITRLGALNLPASDGGPSLAERILRRQLAKKYVPYPVQSEYF